MALEEHEYREEIPLLLTLEKHWKLCVNCKPSEFTGEDNCKMPLRPNLGRNGPDGPLRLYWSQCAVYRKWAQDRERLRAMGRKGAGRGD